MNITSRRGEQDRSTANHKILRPQVAGTEDVFAVSRVTATLYCPYAFYWSWKIAVLPHCPPGTRPDLFHFLGAKKVILVTLNENRTKAPGALFFNKHRAAINVESRAPPGISYGAGREKATRRKIKGSYKWKLLIC